MSLLDDLKKAGKGKSGNRPTKHPATKKAPADILAGAKVAGLGLNPKWYHPDGSVIQITESGVFEDMPIDVYHAQEAVSNSGIKQLLSGVPINYWSSSPLNPNKIPFKASKTLIRGQAFHKWVLEPETFFEEFKVKKGVAQSSIPGYVGEGDLEVIKEADRSLKEDYSRIYRVCIKDSKREVSMFWRDAETGILCRCRHDIFKPDVTTDYKTIAVCTPRECTRSIANYDYPVQAGFYLDGVNECLGIKHTNFTFVFQQSSLPAPVYAVVLEDDIISHGRRLYRSGLRIYADLFAKYGRNRWPGNEDTIKSLGQDEMEFYGAGWWLNKEF